MTRPLALSRLLLVGAAFHLAIALACTGLPEWGDMSVYKIWANSAAEEGIANAYSWSQIPYDWLPLNAWVFWGVGSLHKAASLAFHLGPDGPLLGLLIKTPMIALHLLAAGVLWRISDRIHGPGARMGLVVAAWLFNPGITLATSVIGYQDALHTAVLLLAAERLCSDHAEQAAAWMALAFLSKPQAVIFLFPFAGFLLARVGGRSLLRGLALGSGVAALVLWPFLLGGRLRTAVRMYLAVPWTHPWLSGSAHNLWWALYPAPGEGDFVSDRQPLLLGLSGLTVGLTLLGAFVVVVLAKLALRPTAHNLAHLSAFLAFSFFMVSTQIHENHSYAVFPFLTLVAPGSRFLGGTLVALTVTFSVNLVVTLYWLHTAVDPVILSVPLGVINALINVVILVLWTRRVLAGDRSGGDSCFV